ncbi:molecular chaperone DnaJ [Diaporthe helianthi]|uniref:Molecular chaperone DnaJ n=1 Tax=Diaporthe helianthi TaxID=158607 RepID=A0A2P5ICS7_DIAHE|nr:molecular chaperone DnaJ [Diaporthe helianthi]
MNAPLPPDPYRALGVEPSADSSAIKTAYRKLVLKCHPDKFPDPTLKAQKQEEFQKVQQAYEILGDDDRRRDYDLEVRAKKLREELAKRGGSASTSTPAHGRYVNVNIRTAEPPTGWSPSKYSTPKSSPYKPYSKEFSQSWEGEIPARSKAYHEDERRARRAASYEKPKREDSRERRKREEERERDDRERADRERTDRDRADRERARRREREEREEELMRKEVRQQKKLAKEREAAREREILRKERKARDDREARAEAARMKELKEAKEAKKMRERDRETRRKQEAEDKARAKSKPYLEHPPYSDEDEEVQRSRAKKSSSPKKQSDSPSRDKSTKQRERSNPPEAGVGEEKYRGHMAFAASYMEKIRSKTSKTSPKHTAEVPTYSAAYPDPNEKWAPKRGATGDGKHAKDESTIFEASEPDQTQPEVVAAPPNTQQAPPRLQKSYTMPAGYVPQTQTSAPVPPRVPLNRAATMQPEYECTRPAEKHRSARKRSSFDEDYVQDYYQPPVQTRYHVSSRDTGVPRVVDAKYRDPYPTAGVTFSKVKTAPSYRAENVATSRRYGQEDVMTSEYMQPQYDYRTTATAR